MDVSAIVAEKYQEVWVSRGIDMPGMRVYDGAVRPARQHSRPREAGVGGSIGAGLGG